MIDCRGNSVSGTGLDSTLLLGAQPQKYYLKFWDKNFYRSCDRCVRNSTGGRVHRRNDGKRLGRETWMSMGEDKEKNSNSKGIVPRQKIWTHFKSFLMHINVRFFQIPSSKSLSHSCPQTSETTVRRWDAWAPPFFVAAIMQRWELTDWRNNEQRRAGRLRV